MRKIKVTLILSNHDKAIAYEWLADLIDKNSFELSFVLLNPGGSFIESFLADRKILFKRLHYTGKKDLVKSILSIYRFLKKNKTEVVHTHLFDANLAGLTAARLAGIKARIYSRHHATFHHMYYPKAVRWDRIINSLASKIIAVSENVKNVLTEREHVNASKINVIHHGFMLEEFETISLERKNAILAKYAYKGKFPVVGVVSRYFHLKGIQHIIPAFRKYLEQFPDACLVLANAAGSYRDHIHELLNQLPKDSYREIRFENDHTALYNTFDYFIHVPVNLQIEAFGQTYVEALAAGIPSIFTISGIANEFIVDKKNAMVVPYEDSLSIFEALSLLSSDEQLRNELISNGRADVKKLFDIHYHIRKMEDTYRSMVHPAR